MGLTQQSLTGICGGRNDIWCMENGVDTAALSGASATPALSVERVRDPRVGVKWRTPAVGGFLTMVFDPPISLDVFSVHGLDPVTVPMRLQISSSLLTLGDIRNGPWVPNVDPNVGQAYWFNERDNGDADPVPVVEQIRLGFDAQADLGRVWAGPAHWTPCFSHLYGANQNFTDLSTRQRSIRSGAVFADKAVVQRGHEIQYNLIEPDEWDGPVFELSKVAGVAQQINYIPNYDIYPEERHAILGYNEAINPITALGFQRYQKSFTVREAG